MPEEKGRWFYIGLSVGDAHHEPYQEDPEGTRTRLRKIVDLANALDPNAEWLLNEDEDVSIAIPFSDLICQILKRMGGEEEDTGMYYEGDEVIGGYRIDVQERSYKPKTQSMKPAIKVEEKTYDWLFIKLTEMGWI